MATLQVRLFGKFSLARDGQALSTLGPHKVQEVLAYLLLFRGRPHARETLAGVLWGDTTTAQSKKHLRQALCTRTGVRTTVSGCGMCTCGCSSSSLRTARCMTTSRRA